MVYVIRQTDTVYFVASKAGQFEIFTRRGQSLSSNKTVSVVCRRGYRDTRAGDVASRTTKQVNVSRAYGDCGVSGLSENLRSFYKSGVAIPELNNKSVLASRRGCGAASRQDVLIRAAFVIVPDRDIALVVDTNTEGHVGAVVHIVLEITLNNGVVAHLSRRCAVPTRSIGKSGRRAVGSPRSNIRSVVVERITPIKAGVCSAGVIAQFSKVSSVVGVNETEDKATTALHLDSEMLTRLRDGLVCPHASTVARRCVSADRVEVGRSTSYWRRTFLKVSSRIRAEIGRICRSVVAASRFRGNREESVEGVDDTSERCPGRCANDGHVLVVQSSVEGLVATAGLQGNRAVFSSFSHDRVDTVDSAILKQDRGVGFVTLEVLSIVRIKYQITTVTNNVSVGRDVVYTCRSVRKCVAICISKISVRYVKELVLNCTLSNGLNVVDDVDVVGVVCIVLSVKTCVPVGRNR